jgi:hypothetical protein
MNLKGLLILTFASVAVIVLFSIFWDGSGKEMKSGSGEEVRYGESVAATSVPARFVQIQPVVVENFNYHEVMIDALGYREIRVFAHLSANDSTRLPKEAVLKIGFGYELVGMGTNYGGITINEHGTKYIEGFVIEKIYGKKLKLVVDADNLPKGKYTLQLSYYLLP